MRFLTVQQYKEANEKFEGGAFEKMIFLVSVVFDLDILEVQDWRAHQLIEHYKRALDVVQITQKHKQEIEIDGELKRLIPFNKLSLGMFIDLEAGKDDIAKVCAILYTDKEKYSLIEIDERTEQINELPVSWVYGAYKSYLSFRDSFFKSYDIFTDPFEGIKVDELNDEEKEIYDTEMKEREKQGDQWMTIVNALSQNDITKFEQVLDTNLFLCFNQLTYLKANS